MGKVYINRQDQGREGAVRLADVDSLRERVADILLHIVDPVSGRCVVKQVSRREDVFCGPYVESAPDLVIDWDYSALGDALSYPVRGEPVTVDASSARGDRTAL